MTQQSKTRTAPDSPGTPANPIGLLQRKCDCGTHVTSGECKECSEKREGMLQRKAADSNRTSKIPPLMHEVLRSPGHSLDPDGTFPTNREPELPEVVFTEDVSKCQPSPIHRD
jgi:hypothetical protein